MGFGAGDVILTAIIIIACLAVSIPLSHVALYFIFKSLLGSIPVDRVKEKEEDFDISSLKIPLTYRVLTTLLGTLIYLCFPVFYILLLNNLVLYGRVLLALPFVLCGLIILFKAVTRATCKKYPGMVYLLNERRRKTRRTVQLLIILITASFFILLIMFKRLQELRKSPHFFPQPTQQSHHHE